MNYNQATLHAATGKVLLLPEWKGYFYWNYGTKELNFRNGDYHLSSKELDDKDIKNRLDWYYIT